MILIPCPHCGPRNSSEFRYAGEQSRRPDPNSSDIVVWRAYLYTRSNLAGWTTENWFHRAGCGRYVTVERHTGTNAIRASRPPGAGPSTEGADGEAGDGTEAAL